jgi:hypothetical protein
LSTNSWILGKGFELIVFPVDEVWKTAYNRQIEFIANLTGVVPERAA